jgi:hypothetical protein
MDGTDTAPNKITTTDVDEIRKLLDESVDIANSIRAKAFSLHPDERPKDAGERPEPNTIGAEFIDRLVSLRGILNDSFAALRGFC